MRDNLPPPTLANGIQSTFENHHQPLEHEVERESQKKATSVFTPNKDEHKN